MSWPGPTNTYASDEDPSTGWLFSSSNGFGQGLRGLHPAADDFPGEGITPSGKGRTMDYTPHKDTPGYTGGSQQHLLTSTAEVTGTPPTPEQREDVSSYNINAGELWKMVALHLP